MNKKIAACVLALGMTQVGGAVVAEPAVRPPFSLNLSCLRHNGTVYPGVVAAGQEKIVYGPYTSKCGSIAHIFQFSAASSMRVVIEQQINGSWSQVLHKKININHRLGGGTFRVKIDNRTGPAAMPYKASFSIPL